MLSKTRNIKKVILLVVVSILALLTMIGITKQSNGWAGIVRENWNIRIARNDNNYIIDRYFDVLVDQNGFTGFCIDGGGSLSTRYYTNFNRISIYDPQAQSRFTSVGNWHSAMWLVDHGIATVPRREYDAIYNNILVNYEKSNLQQLLTGAGHTEAAAALGRLTPAQIVAAQNCVYWQLCRNTYSSYNYATIYNNVDAQNFVTGLKALAVANNTYTHQVSSVNIEKQPNFAIDTTTRTLGSFKITGLTSVVKDDLVVEINGITREDVQVVVLATTVNSVTFNIVAPEGVLYTTGGTTNTITVHCKKAITSEGYVLTNGGYSQYLLAVRKAFASISASGSQTNNIMDLALVKSIIKYDYLDGQTSRSIPLDRFNPTIDVDTAPLNNGANYAIYNVDKDKLKVNNNSNITYRLYVFNEGSVNAYAQQLIDYIPTSMEVVEISGNTDPYGQGICTRDNNVYRDDAGNEYNKIIINTSALMNTLNAYNPTTNTISYNFIDVKLNVNENLTGTQELTLRNFAEISVATNGTYVDIDSTPGNLSPDLTIPSQTTDDFNTKVQNLSSYTNLYKVDYLRGTKYNFEDDDDFEQIVLVQPEVDLALRKFISKVESINSNIENFDNSREPKLFGMADVDTRTATFQLRHYAQGNTTMEYIHRKDTVTVKKQDKITYKIRVYNEAIGNDYRACATNILDSLPSGVKILAADTIAANTTAGNNWINWNTSTIDGENWNNFATNQTQRDGGNVLSINSIDSTDKTNIAGKGIPNTLRYVAEALLGESQYYQEVVVVCEVEDTAAVNTTLINTASIGAYRYFTDDNTEVNITNEKNEPSDVILDRDSSVSLETLTALDIVKLEANLDDFMFHDYFYIAYLWIDIGRFKLNDHLLINSVAEKVLESYAPQYHEYVRGVEDDDDFESIIVKESSTEIRLHKIDMNGYFVEGIGFDIQVDSEPVEQKTSNVFGYVDILPNTTIDASEYDYQNVHRVRISEIQDELGKYISVANPIDLFYTFDSLGNIVYTLQGQTDYTLVHNESDWLTFVGAGGAVTNADYLLEDGTTGNVRIVADGNQLTIKVQNKRISGLFRLNIIKVEDTVQRAPVADTVFTIDNGAEVVTNVNGIANGDNGCTYQIDYRGWMSNTIREIDSGADEFVLLRDPVTLYSYVDIVGGKYQVTKVGFSMENTIDIQAIGSITTQEKELVLENGRTVTGVLQIDPSKIVNGMVVIELTIPNPVIQPGQYSFRIRKVDLEGQGLPDVGFTVSQNGSVLDIQNNTDANGFLPIATQVIDDSNVHVIDRFSITEIRIDNDYVAIRQPIDVSVYKYKTNYGFRMIHACFTGGSVTTKTVQLEDGTSVELVIQYSPATGEILLTIPNKKVEYDLALDKFITQVTTGTNTVNVPGREPRFVQNPTITDGDGYQYTPTFGALPAVEVNTNDIVTYNLRIYNEGGADAFATEIVDDVPEGLEFVPYTSGDGSINNTYRWVMYKEVTPEEIAQLPSGTVVKDIDKNVQSGETEFKKCVVTTDVKEADYIVTDYLSKEQGEARMAVGETENPNLLKAFEPTTPEKIAQGPDFNEIRIQFKVTRSVSTMEEANFEVVNYAQITKDSDKNGDEIEDRDSTPNEWRQNEDDQDREKIKVKFFDLSLVKWVSEAIIIEDGVERTEPGNNLEDLQNPYDHRLIYAMTPDKIGEYTDLEPVVKVDLPKSKLENTVVKFKYKIRVYNEGQIDGYAKEITDYVPTGMKFIQEDNPLWQDAGEGKIVTTQLADTLLTVGGAPQTIEIVYTWLNSENNLGLIVNVAEISEDFNNYGNPDIDSTPDNMKVGEDDIDDAAVLLSVRTGDTINTTYIILAASAIALVVTGVVLIKKFVL